MIVTDDTDDGVVGDDEDEDGDADPTTFDNMDEEGEPDDAGEPGMFRTLGCV